jgi:hypothetical protein
MIMQYLTLLCGVEQDMRMIMAGESDGIHLEAQRSLAQHF